MSISLHSEGYEELLSLFYAGFPDPPAATAAEPLVGMVDLDPQAQYAAPHLAFPSTTIHATYPHHYAAQSTTTAAVDTGVAAVWPPLPLLRPHAAKYITTGNVLSFAQYVCSYFHLLCLGH